MPTQPSPLVYCPAEADSCRCTKERKREREKEREREEREGRGPSPVHTQHEEGGRERDGSGGRTERAKRRVADDVSEARILGKSLKQSFAVTWDC